MKSIVAGLVLLLQLQPLVGSAACALFSDRPTEQTCEMLDKRPGTPVSALQIGSTGQGCALAFVCARSPIAAASFTGEEESTLPSHLAAASSPSRTLTSIASASPFHPPKA